MFAMRNDCRLTDCHGDRHHRSLDLACSPAHSIDPYKGQDGRVCIAFINYLSERNLKEF